MLLNAITELTGRQWEPAEGPGTEATYFVTPEGDLCLRARELAGCEIADLASREVTTKKKAGVLPHANDNGAEQETQYYIHRQYTDDDGTTRIGDVRIDEGWSLAFRWKRSDGTTDPETQIEAEIIRCGELWLAHGHFSDAVEIDWNGKPTDGADANAVNHHRDEALQWANELGHRQLDSMRRRLAHKDAKTVALDSADKEGRKLLGDRLSLPEDAEVKIRAAVKGDLLNYLEHAALSKKDAASSTATADLERERASTDNPVQAAINAEAVAALRAALDVMPERDRDAWTLHEVDGLTLRETALKLKITDQEARYAHERAERNLRPVIEKYTRA